MVLGRSPPAKLKRTLGQQTWSNDGQTAEAGPSSTIMAAASTSRIVSRSVEPEPFAWAPLGSEATPSSTRAKSAAPTLRAITTDQPLGASRAVAATAPSSNAIDDAKPISRAQSTDAVSLGVPAKPGASRVPSLGAIAQMHQGRDEVQEWHARSLNAWEEREERPVGGTAGVAAASAPTNVATEPVSKERPSEAAGDDGIGESSVIIHDESNATEVAEKDFAVKAASTKKSDGAATARATTPTKQQSDTSQATPIGNIFTPSAPIRVGQAPTPHRQDPAARLARLETSKEQAAMHRTIKDLQAKLDTASARLSAADTKLLAKDAEIRELADDRDGWQSEAQSLASECDKAVLARLVYKSRLAEAALRNAEADWTMITVVREEKRQAQIQLVLTKNEATYQQNRALELEGQLDFTQLQHDADIDQLKMEAQEAIRKERAKAGQKSSKREEQLQSQLDDLHSQLDKKDAALEKANKANQDLKAKVTALQKSATSAAKERGLSKFIESSSPGPFRPPPAPKTSAAKRGFAALSSEDVQEERTSKKAARAPMQGASEPVPLEVEDEDDLEEPLRATPSPQQVKPNTKGRANAATATSKAAQSRKRVYREDDGEETPEEDDDGSDGEYTAPKKTAPAKSAKGTTAARGGGATAAAGGKVSVLSRAKAAKASTSDAADINKTPMISKTRKPLKATSISDVQPAAEAKGSWMSAKSGALNIADTKDSAEPETGNAEVVKKKRRLINKPALGSLAVAGGETNASLAPNFALPLELSPVKPAAKTSVGGRFGR